MTTSGSNDDLINPADFRSIELRISFENETTRTAVKDGKRIYGEKKSKDAEQLSIALLEIHDRILVLEVPAFSCAEGHRLALTIIAENLPVSPKFPKGAHQIKLTVTVSEAEKAEKGRDRITVEFVDFDEWGWQTFVELYAERQQQILEFFEAVKP